MRRTILILCALILGGGNLLAASPREARAYAAAVDNFRGGLWAQAETDFAEFLQKHPNSTNAPEAALLLAQAQLKQNHFTNAVVTLQNYLPAARGDSDQYVYWLGEAQFLQGNRELAAKTFDSLGENFPDSSLRLRALVESATARAQLTHWAAVEKSLEATNGVFLRAAASTPDNPLVLRGQLLRAQAKFARKDFSGAQAILVSQGSQKLPPDLDWPWSYLFCQTKQAMGDLNGALAISTNLLHVAAAQQNPDWTARSVALRGSILEALNQTDAAVAAYQQNLSANTPAKEQQQAVLKIAELSLAKKQFPAVETNLENYLAQFTNPPAADVALLTLGELYLRDYFADASTNHLQRAAADFSRLINTFTNSSRLGKAYLGRGWCGWFTKDYAGSQNDFAKAARLLSPSEDLAVAKFKLGDTQFALKEFSVALESYRSVLDDFNDFPRVKAQLGARALYQILRADLELNHFADARDVLERIEKLYPNDEANIGSALLLGERLTDARQPAWARKQLERIAAQFPNSPLRPEVRLIIARTYEQENDWPAAINHYLDWQKNFPTNYLRPQVDYSLALANLQVGNETNALALLANFLTRYPANELSPQAQWWVADYHFRNDNFSTAETDYENIFQNTNAVWKSSSLFYPAQMMAGRAAMARQGFADARDYFTRLFGDTNCPPRLRAQAQFACGAAWMQIPSSDTNNALANFQTATNIFGQIIRDNPASDLSARAWGEIANCAAVLSDFSAATNAYAQVFDSSAADIAVRSAARIGLGRLQERLAQPPGADATNLLNQALENYLTVFDGNNLRVGEHADAFWVKEAGLRAAQLIGKLYDARRQELFYRRLEKALPPLKDAIEKKIAALPPEKN